MTYTVKAGDTLAKVAKRSGITLAQLLQANPQIKDPNKIKVGAVLNLPDSSAPADAAKPVTPAPAPAKPAPAKPAAAAKPAVTTAAGAVGKALADALGILSAKYETGGRGPGTVSTGKGDRGGVSYGSYQMASKLGVPRGFVTQSGFQWFADFKGLVQGTPPFSACWKRIAQADPHAFHEAQHAYIKKTHYDVLCAKILSDDKVDVNSRSRALQNVVWSTAVQHGGKCSIVHKACRKVAVAPGNPGYDEALIRAIYAERGKPGANGGLAYFSGSSKDMQKGVANRFRSELKDALAMLAKET
jgi:murein DD-endopeptidase MepM/ murein hydrolase activator NlpD